MADPPPPAPSPPPTQPTSSYIYPVRSLLSGIQPAPDADASSSSLEPNVLLASLRKDAQLRAERQAQQPPSTAPKSTSPGLGVRRGVAGQTSLGIQRSSLPFMRDDSVFSAPLPTKPEASSPTFFSGSSPLARRQSTAESPEPANPPASATAPRRIVSGLENPPTTTAPMTSSTDPPAQPPEVFRHYPADGRDGFLRLAHLPESIPVPNEAEQLSSASGMAVVMHDSVDGAVIRGSMHGGSNKTSKAGTGTGTGTSNAGTDASAQPSNQPSVPGSVGQLSGASSVQPGGAARQVSRSPQLQRGSEAAAGSSSQVARSSEATSISETSDEPLV
ncbi:hypothetical protein FRC07_004351, partial [Ceratobasidium sp. 392]